MNGSRLVPDFRVVIGGEPIPASLRASITAVTCQTGLEGSDRVELTLANQNLRWLDHPALALERDLSLSLGYAPGPLEQVFVGEIVAHGATMPSDGVPTLIVVAQDRMRRLQEGSKVRWFAVPVPLIGNFPLPDPLVGGVVSLENGLIPIFEPIGAALSVILGGAEIFAAIGDPDSMQKIIRKQEGESDFEFLTRIAIENGWELTIDHDGPRGGYELRFFSPLDHLKADLTLEYGRSLISFTPRISNVGQLVSVTAFVWLAPLKLELAVTVSWDWDEMELKIAVSPSFIPLGQGPSHFLIQEPVTPVTAARTLLSHLLPRLNQRLTGTGSTVGDPRILAGSVLQLEGIGVEFGGLYRVTSATHTLGVSGFVTGFEVQKEIWFGSIPLPEQGAIPVQVSLPFAS